MDKQAFDNIVSFIARLAIIILFILIIGYIWIEDPKILTIIKKFMLTDVIIMIAMILGYKK